MNDSHPFVMGIAAKAADLSLGMNPFDPEAETESYELWLDGWCDEQDEQGAFLALFTS